ncbi:PP2C family serine/threonine-protein phosphatase [Endozoicomonadaceae bacterium StTr2]
MAIGIKGAEGHYQVTSRGTEQQQTELHELQSRRAGNKTLRLENNQFVAGHKKAKTTAFLRTVQQALHALGAERKYSPLRLLNHVVSGKIEQLNELDRQQHEAACRLLDRLSGQVCVPTTQLKNRTITVNAAAQHLVNANSRTTAHWQQPCPLTVSRHASLSPIALNNLEYRVEPDAAIVRQKLKDEMLAAYMQQKEEFDKQDTLEDQLEEKAKRKKMDAEELRFNPPNKFDWKTFASTRFASVVEDAAPESIRTAKLAPVQCDAVETWSNAAVATSHGRAPYMEDRHLTTSFNINIGGREYPVKLSGVFDGHGGTEAAEFAVQNIQRFLINRLEEFNPQELTDAGIWNALKLAMVDLNNSYNADLGEAFNPKAGTTANVCLMIDNNLWTANVGDSRALLVGPKNECLQLSRDAKPSDPDFKRSIEQRGGHVDEKADRVLFPDGSLGIGTARSLGEQRFDGVISARPKITKLECPAGGWGGHTLVQGCDGIFDVSTTRDIADFVHYGQEDGLTSEEIATGLVENVYRAGSFDNLSTMVIPLGELNLDNE